MKSVAFWAVIRVLCSSEARCWALSELYSVTAQKSRHLKSAIFWDIRLYSLLKVNLHFEGTCRLHELHI